MEWLFKRLSTPVVEAATAALHDVFCPGAPTGGACKAPDNMITVHVRWGDKGLEMQLVNIAVYESAVQILIERHHIERPVIFFTTEDRTALRAFEPIAKKHKWELHTHEAAIVESGDARIDPSKSGSVGANAFIALILALEARYFVLTSGSNWSRLINELRTTRVDGFCNKCTFAIDVSPGACDRARACKGEVAASDFEMP